MEASIPEARGQNDETGTSGETLGSGVSVVTEPVSQTTRTSDAGPVGGTVGGVRPTTETLANSTTAAMVDTEPATASDDARKGGPASELEGDSTEDMGQVLDGIASSGNACNSARHHEY